MDRPSVLRQRFYNALGKKILEWRRKRGLTQDELGKLLSPEAKKATVSSWEIGRQRVPTDMLVQIAWALGVDERDLLPQGGSGRPSEGEWENRVQGRLARAEDKEAPPRVDEGGHLTEAERRQRRKELEAELAEKLGSRSQAKALATKFMKK